MRLSDATVCLITCSIANYRPGPGPHQTQGSGPGRLLRRAVAGSLAPVVCGLSERGGMGTRGWLTVRVTGLVAGAALAAGALTAAPAASASTAAPAASASSAAPAASAAARRRRRGPGRGRREVRRGPGRGHRQAAVEPRPEHRAADGQHHQGDDRLSRDQGGPPEPPDHRPGRGDRVRARSTTRATPACGRGTGSPRTSSCTRCCSRPARTPPTPWPGPTARA